MKHLITLALTGLTTASLVAAEAKSTISVIRDAAKNLGAKSYSWTTTTETSGPFREGPRQGKADKEYATLTWQGGRDSDTTWQAVFKGTNSVVKVEDEWKTPSELTEGASGDGANRMRFVAAMLNRFKAPAAEAEEMALRVDEFVFKKQDDGSWQGALSPSAIKQMLSFGRRGRGGDGGGTERPGPDTSEVKGSVTFWVKDNVLTRYAYKLEGKMKWSEDRSFDVDRTTTVVIKDIGSTQVEVPEGAKKKLAS